MSASSSCMPPLTLIHLYKWINGLGTFPCTEHRCDKITGLNLSVFMAASESWFTKRKKMCQQSKAISLQLHRLCWLIDWLTDKVTLGNYLVSWLTSWLKRQKAGFQYLAMHWEVQHTYHTRNVLWGSLQYHIRTSTTGLKYQRTLQSTLWVVT